MSTTLWKPRDNDRHLDEYTQISRDKFNLNPEQALAILEYHEHDFNDACNDLQHYVPFEVEVWTDEDKALFNQAFKSHGKNLSAIKKLFFPRKSFGCVVSYYYLWSSKENKDDFKLKMPVSFIV
uniref:SANT domain-containing protein n=1 Tax=Strigamia maritima TaxID=126957 RepID=T1IXP1_STRMM